MKRATLIFLGICLWLIGPCLAFAETGTNEVKGGEKPLKAALFIQNRSGNEFREQVDVLNDQLSVRLTEKGFSIIERDLVASKFSQQRNPGSSFNEASALRIAQMMGADYVVIATLNSYGEEMRTFEGKNTPYATDNHAVICNLRIALKVLEGAKGGTIYGDTVTMSERMVSGQNLTKNDRDVIPRLIETGAKKIAEIISDKIGKMREAKSDSSQLVDFTINCNLEGANVEIDGVSVGMTPNQFTAAPGIHQIRVSKEYTNPWERTVNVIPDLKLNVTLALSDEGIRRYANMEQFQAELERMKRQTVEPIVEKKPVVADAKVDPVKEGQDEEAGQPNEANEAATPDEAKIQAAPGNAAEQPEVAGEPVNNTAKRASK